MYTVCVVPGRVFTESMYPDNFYKNIHVYTALLLIATTVYRSVYTHMKSFLTYSTVTSGNREFDHPFPLRTHVHYNTLSRLMYLMTKTLPEMHNHNTFFL